MDDHYSYIIVMIVMVMVFFLAIKVLGGRCNNDEIISNPPIERKYE